MKCYVDASTIVLLLTLCCCYDWSTCFEMGYTRNQLIALNEKFVNGSRFIPELKKNGIFRFDGPRGTRAGKNRKNKVFTIETIKAKSTHCPSRKGVVHSQEFSLHSQNLVNVKLEKSLPSTSSKGINLSIVNTRSICGPPGKTEDFVDYTIGSHLDICIVTETFLTERNNVTRATLHPQGYSFVDQPRLNGDARGGTGIFFKNGFTVEKSSFGEMQTFEYCE